MTVLDVADDLADLPPLVTLTATRAPRRDLIAPSICGHRPWVENRWCGRCGSLVLAGTVLRSEVCGTPRIFPAGFVHAAHSWCPACKRCHPFGQLDPAAPKPERPEVSPFWRGVFYVQEHRPCDVRELGRALAWPNVCEMHRRLGTPDRNYWYRWRSWGLDPWTADRLATNAGLHPLEVWGDTWEAL